MEKRMHLLYFDSVARMRMSDWQLKTGADLRSMSREVLTRMSVEQKGLCALLGSAETRGSRACIAGEGLPQCPGGIGVLVSRFSFQRGSPDPITLPAQ